MKFPWGPGGTQFRRADAVAATVILQSYLDMLNMKR